MLEFEDFVYLDVQKTGSTTIRRFLNRFSRTRVVQDDKHAPVERRDPDKLYIISCRDPLKQYLSLYLHGPSDKGGLRARLNKADMAHFYDGTNEGFAVKTETLTDLRNLVMGEHTALFYDPNRADRFLDKDKQANTSTNPGIDLEALSPALVARVQEREWFFFDHLGYRPYIA